MEGAHPEMDRLGRHVAAIYPVVFYPQKKSEVWLFQLASEVENNRIRPIAPLYMDVPVTEEHHATAVRCVQGLLQSEGEWLGALVPMFAETQTYVLEAAPLRAMIYAWCMNYKQAEQLNWSASIVQVHRGAANESLGVFFNEMSWNISHFGSLGIQLNLFMSEHLQTIRQKLAYLRSQLANAGQQSRRR